MRALLALTLLCLAPLTALAQSDAACGVPQAECPVGNGFYRLALPKGAITGLAGGAGAPVPALVFLHGGSSTAASVMRNTAMLADLSARGYALIAPEGQPRPGRSGKNWGVFDNRTHPRDDIAFIADVLDDAKRRGIDRDRVLLAGFSRGGSMVWDIACRAPAMARAYAAIAGAFWEPLPTVCDGPIDLFHSHGWTDRVVPIEGRSFRDGTVVQGDVFAGLKVLRRTNGCGPQQPDAAPMEAKGGLWFRSWTKCPGGRLDLMLHPGGHGVPRGWLERALDWFEARESETPAHL
jgi:polyhydroxybutyrate depolymerase